MKVAGVDKGGVRETELGELPGEWWTATLGEVARQRKETVSPTGKGDAKYVGLEHIDSGESRLRGHGFDDGLKSNKFKFVNGDILYGKLRPYLDKCVLSNDEGICSTDIIVVQPSEAVDNGYLCYLMHTKSFIGYATKSMNGVTLPRTSWSVLKSFALPLPPLPEQQKIAAVLSAVQEAKEKTEAVISAARELKRSMMKHLFTYGPVPVEDAVQVRLKETEIGEMPEHWEVAKVNDVAKIVSGGTPSREKNEYWDGDIPWVKTGEIHYSQISYTEEKITLEGLNNSSTRIIPKGTLLMAMYGQGITRGKVAILNIDAAINQACAAFLLSDKIDANFLHYYFTHSYNDIRAVGHGANQKNLSAALIKTLDVPVPPLKEQRQISKVLSASDAVIAVEDAKLQSLSSLFTSLLHHLMTGKVRVNDLEVPV